MPDIPMIPKPAVPSYTETTPPWKPQILQMENLENENLWDVEAETAI
jgi:hypothetical protein